MLTWQSRTRERRIQRRIQDALAVAGRARGRKGGRKLALSKAQVRLAQAAMARRELGIRPVTLYRYGYARRQAAPFAKPLGGAPKRPGRRAGTAYGVAARRRPPVRVRAPAASLPGLRRGVLLRPTGVATHVQEELPPTSSGPP